MLSEEIDKIVDECVFVDENIPKETQLIRVGKLTLSDFLYKEVNSIKRRLKERFQKRVGVTAFNEEEIEKMREMMEDKDIISDDDIEILKKLKGSALVNDVSLAKLFLRCYEYFNHNYYLFKGEEGKDNFVKRLRDYLNGEAFYIQELRQQVREFGDGQEFGSYVASQNINRIVDEQRVRIMEIILMFFRIFGEED